MGKVISPGLDVDQTGKSFVSSDGPKLVALQVWLMNCFMAQWQTIRSNLFLNDCSMTTVDVEQLTMTARTHFFSGH